MRREGVTEQTRRGIAGEPKVCLVTCPVCEQPIQESAVLTWNHPFVPAKSILAWMGNKMAYALICNKIGISVETNDFAHHNGRDKN
jgi:hypothetical protein